MPAPPLRTLLLQEDATPGGVFTITQQLSHALQHAGHEVQSCALRTCTQRQLYHAARSADLLIATHNFRPAYAAWLLGLCTRRPVLVWFHGPLQEVLAAAHAHPAKRRWLRWLYARLPHLVFVSQAAHDSYLRFMAGTPLEGQTRCVIVNAHPAWLNSPQAPQAVASERAGRMGFVGRLAAEKNPQRLLETLACLPAPFQLDMVGDGPLRTTLAAQGQALHAEGRLQLWPFQPVDAALYQRWQITLLASHYEGCPMAVLESLAAGVPCAATPIPALQEMLAPAMPYALASDDSAAALAAAVRRVCALPPERLAQDIARVLARYRPADFAHAWSTLVQRTARPHPTRAA